MKILQINTTISYGSTGKIAEQIGTKVLQNNGKSYIAFGRHENLSQSKKIRIGNRIEQAYQLFLTRFFDKHGFGFTNGTKALIKRIKLINPDIIHLHQIHGYYLNIDVFFSFLAQYKKPVIWTLHDSWAYTGHCCYYVRFECTKWKTGCYECPLKRYYPKSFLFDNSKDNYRIKSKLFNSIEEMTLVPVSEWLVGEVSKSFLKEKEINPIHNGVDINTFKYTDPSPLIEKHNLNGEKVILGVANEWSKIKGLHDFIALSKLVDKNIKIILVGLSAFQKKNLPSNIIGISRLRHSEDLARYFSLADVFLTLSIAESFGLVTIEAMSCGTPVVGYNVTATPELIKPGTGYLVDKSDINGLLIKINKVLSKGRENYSFACRKNVVENYNIDNQFDKYIDLYKRKVVCSSLNLPLS